MTKINKIFKIWIDDSGYEEYDGFVVIAKNYKEAKEFIFTKYELEDSYSWGKYKNNHQCVGMSPLEKQVVLESFIRA